LNGHTGHVQCVAWSPDGKTLASGATDGSVRLWEVATGKNTATFQTEQDVTSVVWSPDGDTLASCGLSRPQKKGRPGQQWGEVRIWLLKMAMAENGDQQKVKELLPWNHQSRVTVAFSLDGKTLVGASDDPNKGK